MPERAPRSHLGSLAEPALLDHRHLSLRCRPAPALRQIKPAGRENGASDHDLHSRAVSIAGQRDVAGKLLNKMLDKRHEAYIRRFTKARTALEVRSLWVAALERGDIPGAYWAVLSHPATDQALVTEVFGEVHMLSRLVGMSNRADIVRLRQLEGELGERNEKIMRQEARLLRMSRQRQELTQRIEELDQELRCRSMPTTAVDVEASAVPALKQRFADERARSALLVVRVGELEQALAAREQDLRRFQETILALRDELGALESTLADVTGTETESTRAVPDLAGRRLLYVGGRPKQLEQLRSLASRLGGTLLTHDGGHRGEHDAFAGPGQSGGDGLLPGRLRQPRCSGAGEAPMPRRRQTVHASAQREPRELSRSRHWFGLGQFGKHALTCVCSLRPACVPAPSRSSQFPARRCGSSCARPSDKAQ